MSIKKASEQQARKLAAVVVEHQEVFTTGMSEDIQWAITNPSEALSIFVSALMSRTKEAAKEVKAVIKKVLTPFITITTGRTISSQLIADIEAMPMEVTGYAKSMPFTVSQDVGTVSLVAISIKDLDLKTRRTDEFMTEEFCARFSTKYLDGYIIELCQQEDGPQLRKQWKDQSKGTKVWLAMKRIADLDGGPNVWCVERDGDGELRLNGVWADPDFVWSPDDVIVFRFRKVSVSSAT